MYLQEIRYYNTVLSESVFKDYIMNPYSNEGNSINSSPDQLAFRLTLGGELYTGSVSIHPKITGSWAATSSFVTNSSASFASTPTFVPNTEYFFLDQPVVGIKNAIADKIRVENAAMPTGSVLSPFRSLSQNLAASQSYTANTNLLEVAFAPQDEINDDIISQIGYFNIGEFIGDPRQRSSSATSYPDLDRLRNEYFEKYTSNYDLNDYIRLIKYFDNSLFKMIKDFVPARTSLASGVVIKQTLLERNKYPQPQVDTNSTIAYASSGSQNNIPLIFQDISVSGTVAPQWNDYQPGTIENFSGGTGGSFEPFNGINTSPYGPNGTGPENIYFITQSWNEGIVTPLGIANTIHSTQDEFYDGEFSGSALVVTTQSLAQPLSLNLTPLLYNTTGSNSTTPPAGRINWVTNTGGTGANSYLWIPRIHINEVDANGVNIQTALNNLTAGSQVTFTIGGEILPASSPFTAYTITATISSVVLTSPTTYTLNFTTAVGAQSIFYSPFNPSVDSLSTTLVSSNVFLNPFLNDVPNYYNSDYNPLINNVLVDRLGTIYQDVDYSTGIYTPTNFDLLISGSALKAAVQDSNYTSKRVTIPRYEGSKSTSQNLNYWTPGDTGTYGKLPTIDNLKTAVAYCDDIGGWPPERMEASAIFIKYLIKSDGSVVIPNTSENSLYDVRGNFETGDEVLISSAIMGGGQVSSSREVIRGGSTIVPLMTTQIGQESNTSNAQWTGSIRFTDPNDPTTFATFTTGSSPNTFWKSGSGAGYKNAIWLDISVANRSLPFDIPTSVAPLIVQDALPNSGLNAFVHPGTILPGDEIRFMGLEENTFMIISSSYTSSFGIPERLILHLDKPIPAPTTPNFDLNKFLLRRYVDEPGQTIITGYKPTNSTGPYIVRPKYVVPELNKNVDDFILILKEKGLI
jgi:hypothetical protein